MPTETVKKPTPLAPPVKDEKDLKNEKDLEKEIPEYVLDTSPVHLEVSDGGLSCGLEDFERNSRTKITTNINEATCRKCLRRNASFNKATREWYSEPLEESLEGPVKPVEVKESVKEPLASKEPVKEPVLVTKK